MKTLHLAIATALLAVTVHSAHSATIKSTFVLEQNPLVSVHTGNTPAKGLFEDTYIFTVLPKPPATGVEFSSGSVTVSVGNGENAHILSGFQAILDDTIGFEHSNGRFGPVFLSLQDVVLTPGQHKVVVSGESYGGSYALTMEAVSGGSVTPPSQVPIPGLVWMTGAFLVGLLGYGQSKKSV